MNHSTASKRHARPRGDSRREALIRGRNLAGRQRLKAGRGARGRKEDGGKRQDGVLRRQYPLVECHGHRRQNGRRKNRRRCRSAGTVRAVRRLMPACRQGRQRRLGRRITVHRAVIARAGRWSGTRVRGKWNQRVQHEHRKNDTEPATAIHARNCTPPVQRPALSLTRRWPHG